MLRIALRVRLRYAPLRMTHRGIVLQYFIVFNTSSASLKLDTCLAAARSRSGENNTQLFSKTLAPLRYPLEKATVIDTSNNRLVQIENRKRQL